MCGRRPAGTGGEGLSCGRCAVARQAVRTAAPLPPADPPADPTAGALRQVVDELFAGTYAIGELMLVVAGGAARRRS